MKIEDTHLAGVKLITLKVYADERGFFEETHHAERYAEAGIPTRWVQSNHSRSVRHVLRGLHYQLRKPQAKLVTVVRGAILDVVVDIRRGSATFGQHLAVELSDENHRQIFVPCGLAHGFCVLSDVADIWYQCSDYYAPGDEGGVLWSDPDLGIPWPPGEPNLSAKDRANPRLRAIPLELLPQYQAAQ